MRKDKASMNYYPGGSIIPWILNTPKGPRAALPLLNHFCSWTDIGTLQMLALEPREAW